MKTIFFIVSVSLILTCGCSSVDTRARKNPNFPSWPATVQDKVLAGQVDIGLTREQVEVALGAPDRIFVRTTADGTTEVWSYRDRGPRFSFGLGIGVGSIGRSSATSLGVGLGTGGGYRDDEKMGVVFDRSGRVSAVETRRR